MQFKRWATRTGKVTEFLQGRQSQLVQDENLGSDTDNESTVESEDEEINRNLITWLEQWQTREELRVRGKFLEPKA
jgi:predicted  nucleic acid-binding Zn ribbon protein